MPIDKLIKGKLYSLPNKIFYEYVGPYTHTDYKRGEYMARCSYAVLTKPNGRGKVDIRDPGPGMFLGSFGDLRKGKNDLAQCAEKTFQYIHRAWSIFVRHRHGETNDVLPVFLSQGEKIIFPYFWDCQPQPEDDEDDEDSWLPSAFPTYKDYLKAITAL